MFRRLGRAAAVFLAAGVLMFSGCGARLNAAPDDETRLSEIMAASSDNNADAVIESTSDVVIESSSDVVIESSSEIITESSSEVTREESSEITAESSSESLENTANAAAGGYVVNGKNGKIHIKGACAATKEGSKSQLTQPVYFDTFDEAEAYSAKIKPNEKKRKCGNCF